MDKVCFALFLCIVVIWGFFGTLGLLGASMKAMHESVHENSTAVEKLTD